MDLFEKVKLVLSKINAPITDDTLNELFFIINAEIEEIRQQKSIDFNARTMALDMASKTT